MKIINALVLNHNAQLCKYSFGWFFVARFFAYAAGQLFVALRDCFAMLAMTGFVMAQCAALVWGKNRDAKNHRSVARGGLQNTEVARNVLNVWFVNVFMIGI